MKQKTSGIESQLRQAIIEADMSRHRLSQLSGVDRAQLSYFVQGKRTLTLGSAEKIAEVLGLRIKNISQSKETKRMRVIKRTKAMNIQLGITKKLNKLKSQEKLNPKDFDYLDKRTHELYRLAKEADKLKEIKKIIEK